MKKQKLALLGVAAVSILALASCGGNNSNPTTPKSGSKAQTGGQTGTGAKQESINRDDLSTNISYVADTKGLDLVVHYNGQQGITFRGESAIVNTVDNESYTKGKLLPTWKSYSTTLKTEFRDANDYTSTTDAALLTQYVNANFETAAGAKVDVVMGDVKGINTQGNNGKLLDLAQELDNMPYFKYFLEHNPSIRKSITSGGSHIYYTPYFDGYNAIERMFLMDTTMIKNLLDSADGAGDTSKSGKDAAANTLQAAKFTPFINADYNYAQDTTVKISVNGVAKDLTIKKTTNIIKQQNELLANGCTGAQLLTQFKNYLKAAFGANYTKLSDIFASESAAYNTDEMIALMRVVKANPGLATGDSSAEIEIMVPRQAANNRVDNIADLMEIFGVSMDSETSMYFYDGAGKINDGASIMSTYGAVEKLSQLYDEGLILYNFWNNNPTQKNYLGQYFGKTVAPQGYGFMMYDYSASTTAMDSKDEDGIGTDDNARKGAFEGTKMEGFTPVLPPLTYWTTKEMTKAAADAELGSEADRSVKELVRYSDSNRALKTSSWAIPATTDNKEKALQLLDYLFSKDGRMINDFGPKNYWKSSTELGTYGGKETPEFSQALKDWFSDSNTDFWTFMRGYVGSTMGIGYVRSASINYLATNKWGKIGTLNLETAIGDGVVTLALVDNPNTSKLWANSVPTAGWGTSKQDSSFGAVTAFWSADKCAATAGGWVAVVSANYESISSTLSCGESTDAGGAYNYGQVINQAKNQRRLNYLYETVAGIDSGAYVPDWVLE